MIKFPKPKLLTHLIRKFTFSRITKIEQELKTQRKDEKKEKKRKKIKSNS